MPPFVDVLDWVLVVLLLVVLVDEPVTEAPPLDVPLLVVRPVEPPPVGGVVPLEAAPVFELEFELDPVVEPAPVFDDEEFVETLVLPVFECTAGTAVLVGGTVKAGAPLASLLPRPPPPQAESATPASRAAPPARTARRRGLCTGRRMCFTVEAG